jgi:hypothetical protein
MVCCTFSHQNEKKCSPYGNVAANKKKYPPFPQHASVGAKNLAHAISMARLHSSDNIIHTKQNFEKPFQ